MDATMTPLICAPKTAAMHTAADNYIDGCPDDVLHIAYAMGYNQWCVN